jgi:hypothetical protein
MPKTVLPSKFQEWKGLDRISTVMHEMIIEKVPISGIANFAIPNDPALYEDDAGQLEFFSAESAETDSEEDENDEY